MGTPHQSNQSINMASRLRLHSVFEGYHLQTFLGCFKLSTGCNIIGALLLTAGIASLVGASTVIEEGGKGWGAVFVYSYTSGIVAILSSAHLFVGVNAKKSTMVLAWLATMMVYFIAMFSLCWTIVALHWNDSPHPVQDVIFVYTRTLLFDLALGLFVFYCYAVVSSFYMELKESKKKEHHSDDSESTPLIDRA